MTDFIKKYKKWVIAVLGGLAIVAGLTATGVDDQIVKAATDFVNQVAPDNSAPGVSPTTVAQ